MREIKVGGSICVCVWVGGPVLYCGNQASAMNQILSLDSSSNNKKNTPHTENNECVYTPSEFAFSEALMSPVLKSMPPAEHI